ncbi:4991_t:CDS:2 [Ambispora leptoticha]|uniref:4991_t:CDS:1 n=1 Tax=Ambispora leptoticha TaxID=144679 RepID=A0A9N9ANW3_9GLOM|nr:4991_t:CDS:2 [Ambispora leptoticha]
MTDNNSLQFTQTNTTQQPQPNLYIPLSTVLSAVTALPSHDQSQHGNVSQPQMTSPMYVPTSMPTDNEKVETTIMNDNQTKDWENHFFGCFDVPELCDHESLIDSGQFFQSENKAMLQKKPVSQTCSCFLYSTCIFYGCLGMFNREQIRKTLGIKGGACSDCFAHSFCPCCAMIQENRELKQI